MDLGPVSLQNISSRLLNCKVGLDTLTKHLISVTDYDRFIVCY